MNKYWDNICAMQQKQAEKGLRTYGMPLEGNKEMPFTERVEMAQEEMVDFLVYCEHIKARHKQENIKEFVFFLMDHADLRGYIHINDLDELLKSYLERGDTEDV